MPGGVLLVSDEDEKRVNVEKALIEHTVVGITDGVVAINQLIYWPLVLRNAKELQRLKPHKTLCVKKTTYIYIYILIYKTI